MSDQDKMEIHEILDMFNEAVGYDGLDNTGKITKDRDDVITRHVFHNWVGIFNKTHTRPIKSQKVDQYTKVWFRNDIEKLIKTPIVQKKLKNAYLKETIDLYGENGIYGLPSRRVSKKYKEKMDERNNDGFVQAIKSRMEQLIDEIIEHHFTLLFDGNQINGKNYINKNEIIKEFIDMKRVEEEAFKIEDNFYGIPEYDSVGNIVAVHHKDQREKTEYLLKNSEKDSLNVQKE
ncbi:hypothetical protein OPHB3_2416 [Oceanobacillus picturae]|uniref:Uncharacterized protein n=1 Tax=Oceanobacillus picturae TaxID=171693 RepID=A0A0U9HHU1_9BACI|nr:hypothetical protein [Oceanobacillus picturae]GAQ18476.1 hypothetical protein OPHB3_2416 [Oceanobacillus picturae]